MTNRTNAQTSTHFHNVMAQLDESQSALLAKYGMSLNDLPGLLRRLADSYDEGRSFMEPQDERLTLIYFGMNEMRMHKEAAEKLANARAEIRELYLDIDDLNSYGAYLEEKLGWNT